LDPVPYLARFEVGELAGYRGYPYTVVPTDTKEGANIMYRIAKSIDRKMMDMIQVKCNMDEIE
jgi:hypothetical protein